MTCPLCQGQLQLRGRSLDDASRDIYFCQSCPMTYALLRAHEQEAIEQRMELVRAYGGKPAFGSQ